MLMQCLEVKRKNVLSVNGLVQLVGTRVGTESVLPSRLQFLCNTPKLLQGGFQILYDLGSNNIRLW